MLSVCMVCVTVSGCSSLASVKAVLYITSKNISEHLKALKLPSRYLISWRIPLRVHSGFGTLPQPYFGSFCLSLKYHSLMIS